MENQELKLELIHKILNLSDAQIQYILNALQKESDANA